MVSVPHAHHRRRRGPGGFRVHRRALARGGSGFVHDNSHETPGSDMGRASAREGHPEAAGDLGAPPRSFSGTRRVGHRSGVYERKGKVRRKSEGDHTHPVRRRLRGLVHQLARGEDDLLPHRLPGPALPEAGGGGRDVRLRHPQPAGHRLAGHRARQGCEDVLRHGIHGHRQAHRRAGGVHEAGPEADIRAVGARSSRDGQKHRPGHDRGRTVRSLGGGLG